MAGMEVIKVCFVGVSGGSSQNRTPWWIELVQWALFALVRVLLSSLGGEWALCKAFAGFQRLGEWGLSVLLFVFLLLFFGGIQEGCCCSILFSPKAIIGSFRFSLFDRLAFMTLKIK